MDGANPQGCPTISEITFGNHSMNRFKIVASLFALRTKVIEQRDFERRI